MIFSSVKDERNHFFPFTDDLISNLEEMEICLAAKKLKTLKTFDIENASHI